MAEQPTQLTLESDPARFLYVVEGRSIRAVADALKGQPGCSKGTIERRCKAEDWPSQQAAFQRQTAERAAEINRIEAAAQEAAAAKKKADAADARGQNADAADGGADTRKAAPADWMGEWADQVEQVARVKAKKIAERTGMLDQMVDAAIDGCQIAINEAIGWLMAQRSRVRSTGEVQRNASGEVLRDPSGEPLPVLEVEHEDIGWTTRASALQMLSSAVGTLRTLLQLDPVLLGRERVMSLREVQARVNLIEARVAGTLPPEKVEHMAPDSDEFTEFLRSRLGGQDRLGVLYGPKQRAAPTEPEPDPHSNN